MTETVTNTNERKSLFSSFLEVLEAREKQVQAERQLEEEKYQRRTQRIYDFHERQRREAAELRRCLEYVSQHAHVLETVLRGGGGGEGVPLGAALLRQAAALQGCMAQCVANAARIRQLLTAAHRPQMDTMLAKMEAELSTWTAFLQRAVDAAYSSEVVVDNLHNMIGECVALLYDGHVPECVRRACSLMACRNAHTSAPAAEQRRCVRELSASRALASLCAPGGGDESPRAPLTPQARRAPAAVSSTPIPRD